MWLDVSRRCEYATFFHTPLWSELITRAFPALRNATRYETLANGVRVVFPLVEVDRRLHGRSMVAHSSGFGYYGGPIADGPLDERALGRVYRDALRGRIGDLEVFQNPLAPFPPPRPRTARVQEDFTDMVSLEGGPSRVMERFDGERRRLVKKGKASGVRSRIATTKDDYRSYFATYQDSLNRWGEGLVGEPVPWNLFEACHDLAGRHPAHLKLWLAEQDGETLSGIVCLYWNRHVSCWHAAGSARGRESFALFVLMADAMEEACDSGFSWFDLHGSGGLEGVAWYKSRFGGERKPLVRVRYQTPLVRFAGTARNRLGALRALTGGKLRTP